MFETWYIHPNTFHAFIIVNLVHFEVSTTIGGSTVYIWRSLCHGKGRKLLKEWEDRPESDSSGGKKSEKWRDLGIYESMATSASSPASSWESVPSLCVQSLRMEAWISNSKGSNNAAFWDDDGLRLHGSNLEERLSKIEVCWAACGI